MKTVWKFAFEVVMDEVVIRMPKGAETLCVQVQNSAPCLWALVDADAPMRVHKFQVRGTGHNADDVGSYVGTFQSHGGAFVGHVFDAGELPGAE